jgi:hypothetical protein
MYASASHAGLVRWLSMAAATSVGIVPAVILLTGRAIMDRTPNTSLGLFWTNHAAAPALLISLGVWLAIPIGRLPDALRDSLSLDFSVEEATIIGIALLAGLLPGWMWTFLLIVATMIAGSALLLQHIE